MRKLDITGTRYGRLTAVECTQEKQNGNYMWRCKCDCGREVIVKADHLRRGDTQSCGCINKGRQKGVPKRHGGACDGCRDRLYGVWAGMHSRCNNPKHVGYKYYGERGIKICTEWGDYEVFRNWALSHGYDPAAAKGDCTIDRINCDGDYEPGNCRWVDITTQNRNRRKRRNELEEKTNG